MPNDQGVRKLVAEQMGQWSEMMERHRKEEWNLLKNQVTEQQDILNRVMEQVHATQMKQLEAKHERLVICFVNVNNYSVKHNCIKNHSCCV